MKSKALIASKPSTASSAAAHALRKWWQYASELEAELFRAELLRDCKDRDPLVRKLVRFHSPVIGTGNRVHCSACTDVATIWPCKQLAVIRAEVPRSEPSRDEAEQYVSVITCPGEASRLLAGSTFRSGGDLFQVEPAAASDSEYPLLARNLSLGGRGRLVLRTEGLEAGRLPFGVIWVPDWPMSISEMGELEIGTDGFPTRWTAMQACAGALKQGAL